MVTKKYEELDLFKFWGRPLEMVVNQLLEYRKQGRLVSTPFNGVMLYSDTVTMDDAYLKIVGMNKAEFDVYAAELSTD